MAEEKKTVYEIEKIADLVDARKEGDTNIVFSNDGKMVVRNRAYERNMKRIWRATQEGQKSIHFYTKKKNKTNRKTKKQERQNRKKGRK